MLIDGADFGDIGALVIVGGLAVSALLDLLMPTEARRAALEKTRKAKATKVKAEVAVIWQDKETALDYLRLQGHTTGSALREYERRQAMK